MLYDSSVITVSLYKGQRLTPKNVASGYIYGIGDVLSQAQTNGRRLQVVPKTPTASPTATNLSANPILPTIISKDPVNIEPVVFKPAAASSPAAASTISYA